jgi:hypothetical protein
MNKIICSAIHFDDGCRHVHQPKNIDRGFVICGRRHHNCYTTYALIKNADMRAPNEQGFLTDDDRFVDREEGMRIAFEAGQIPEKKLRLFSEDLY